MRSSPGEALRKNKMEIIIIWLILCGVVAFIADARGHSGGAYFMLSFILSPLIGLIIAVAVPAKK